MSGLSRVLIPIQKWSFSRILFFTNSSFKITLEKQHTNFIRKGTTTLDPGAAALETIKAAQAEYEFALNKADLEKKILNYKHDLQSELYKLFVHGFLHIFGYDHVSKKDYEVMEELESNVLSGPRFT